MTETDVAIILALANGHDQRQGIDDVRVQAWHSLLSQEAPDMTRGWASEQINRHYARSTDMLMPAHLVTEWRRRKQYVSDRYAIPQGPGRPMPDWFRALIGGSR
jgi:hypothetical protein